MCRFRICTFQDSYVVYNGRRCEFALKRSCQLLDQFLVLIRHFVRNQIMNNLVPKYSRLTTLSILRNQLSFSLALQLVQDH